MTKSSPKNRTTSHSHAAGKIMPNEDEVGHPIESVIMSDMITATNVHTMAIACFVLIVNSTSSPPISKPSPFPRYPYDNQLSR